MTQQHINTGTSANDNTGDPLRTAFLKVESDLNELYTRAPGGLSGPLAADAATGNYRVSVIADYATFMGVANGLASLGSDGKIPTSQLPAAVLGALQYQGVWNASTNSPALVSGVGTKGYYYKVSVAGTTSIDGNAVWVVGDWIVYNGTTWDKIDNNEAITSVAGLTGAISVGGLKTALNYSYSDITGAAPLASPALTGVPTAPTPSAGDSSTKISTTAFGWTNFEALGKTKASNVQVANYTLVLTDAGAPVRTNNASANTVTVPPNSSVAFPVETYVNLEQYGAGQTSIVAGAGVTIRTRNGLKMAGQYAMGTLHKIATDEWMLGGDVSA